jgi:hypothetical protein
VQQCRARPRQARSPSQSCSAFPPLLADVTSCFDPLQGGGHILWRHLTRFVSCLQSAMLVGRWWKPLLRTSGGLGREPVRPPTPASLVEASAYFDPAFRAVVGTVESCWTRPRSAVVYYVNCSTPAIRADRYFALPFQYLWSPRQL